jgi:hypothetical protein
MTKKILLQSTIVPTADDWSIARFSLLADHLRSLKRQDGTPLFDVVARDRDVATGPDAVLSTLDASDFDQLWLFAVDTGTGLSPEDCAAVGRFRARGGGMLVTRDHMDLGSSVCSLGGVGKAHHFHSKNQETDPARRHSDDTWTPAIEWPNYHSGANGDYQAITPAGALHPVLHDPASPGSALRYLPSHPHEGAVSAPPDERGTRVIATGHSTITGVPFNIAVAFEPMGGNGPAIAQSTFHHFTDYNWDIATGAPSFVSEPPGHAMKDNPEALRSTKAYVRNVALWLSNLLD